VYAIWLMVYGVFFNGTSKFCFPLSSHTSAHHRQANTPPPSQHTTPTHHRQHTTANTPPPTHHRQHTTANTPPIPPPTPSPHYHHTITTPATPATQSSLFLGMGADLYKTVFQLYHAPEYYLVIVFVIVLCLWRDVTWKFFSRTHLPQSYHIVQELQAMDQLSRKTDRAASRKICIFFSIFLDFLPISKRKWSPSL
jgi:hypothetical protein